MTDVDYDLLAEHDGREDDDQLAPPAGPFAAAALEYWRRGWLPLVLDPARKAPPPSGYTGRHPVPSRADVQTWLDFRGDGNVALRMPPTVVGIDVDDYDDKHGAETLDQCEARWGPLPATWRTTSRTDGRSAIRYYRLPEPIELAGKLPGGDVEIIQHHHRYAVAPPSLHPEGRTYATLDPDGAAVDFLPPVQQLPALPPRWVDELAALATSSPVDKADADHAQVEAWKAALRQGTDPCDKVTAKLQDTLAAMRDGSRHDAMVAGTMGLMSLGAWGHGGAYEALRDLRTAFVDAVTTDTTGGRRTEREAQAEWDRAVVGAVRGKITDHPTPRRGCPCGSDLTDVIEAARAYQHLPDPTHLLVALAVAATAEDDGEPVWLLVVAAPSSGKTEVIRALDDVTTTRLNEVTAAGLLSWKAGKRPKATGVLTRVTRGLVTFGDLSNLLATSDRGGRDTTFAMLRRIYDGEVSRDLGNAPEPLAWEGRLTVVAAVTGIIDRYAAHADALGPRWVYVRLAAGTTSSRRRASRMARRGGLTEARDRLRAAAAAVVRTAQQRLPDDLPESLEDAIEDAALVTCWGRAAVPRHGYGRREIDGIPTVEEPPRLIHQLRGVARGLVAIGLPEPGVEQTVRRVALDSMPADRFAVLSVLADGEPLSTAEVSRRSRLDRKVARFRLEELQAIGVVRGDRQGEEPDDEERDTRPATWRLDGHDGQLIADVLNAPRAEGGWDEMWVPTPQPPQ